MIYRIFFCTIICLIQGLVQAHSPNELGFKFIQEKDHLFLEVHLTTITLFDLLQSVEPEMQSEESLNLNHYNAVYQRYFNESLKLILNGRERTLVHADANLLSHDASITYLVQDFEEEILSYNLTVGGFDFYQRPSFTILFRTRTIDETYFLNKTNNTCSGLRQIQNTAGTPNGYMYMSFMLLLLTFVLISLWFARMVGHNIKSGSSTL